jgi:hypothetical protein
MSKTHVIDGVTYVEVGRNAEIGEKVIIVDNTSSGFTEGHVGVVTFVGNDRTVEIDRRYFHRRGDYLVVTDATPDIHGLLANLARRVASLEQQLRDTQGNVEKLAEELANVKYSTEAPTTPDESIPQYWAEALIRSYGGNR